MKKTLLLIFATFFFAASVAAQSNFKQGYIITNSGDTLQGQIDFRTDAANAIKCKFILQQTGEETMYYPGDIKGYRFSPDGKYYVSYQVKINDVSQELFLEYLVHGMMNLYYSQIAGKEYYFFEKEGQMIEISKNPDKMGEFHVITDNKYKHLISYYFKDYPSITKNLMKMDYNQKSFITVAKQYHNETCTTGEECIIFEQGNPDKRSIILKFAVYGGVQFKTYMVADVIKYNNYDYYDFKSTQPVIGGKLSLLNPRWSKSFSAHLDLSLSQFSSSDTYKMYNVERHYKLKAMLVTGKIGVEYKLPLKTIRPAISGGVAYTSFFADKSKYTTSSDREYDYNLRSTAPGFYVNIGADYVFENMNAIQVRASIERYTAEDRSLEHGVDKFESFNVESTPTTPFAD